MYNDTIRVFDEEPKKIFVMICSLRERGPFSHEIYQFACNISQRNFRETGKSCKPFSRKL